MQRRRSINLLRTSYVLWTTNIRSILPFFAYGSIRFDIIYGIERSIDRVAAHVRVWSKVLKPPDRVRNKPWTREEFRISGGSNFQFRQYISPNYKIKVSHPIRSKVQFRRVAMRAYMFARFAFLAAWLLHIGVYALARFVYGFSRLTQSSTDLPRSSSFVVL